MTFYTFMMRNHRGKNTPEGDLAGDIFQDRESFPRNGKGKFDGWHRILRGYLERQHACSDICPKLVCPGFDGMPDRLVLLPDGNVGFVEVKAPGQKPRPLQVSRHKLLMSLGLQVFTLDDITAIPRMLDEIGGKHDNTAEGEKGINDSGAPAHAGTGGRVYGHRRPHVV